MNTNKRKAYKKKRYLFTIIIILILIALRIALPFIVKNYVNKTLANIPGYYGQVSDIDISLIRGAYGIKGLYLDKVDAASQTPFLDFKQTDISVEWKSLFKGKIVSEIIMDKPTVTYVLEDQGQAAPDDPGTEDWTRALTDIVPIDINTLEIYEGKVAFVQINASPSIDMDMHDIKLQATNLRNVVREGNELPSKLEATAVSFGNGTVKLNGKMDLVKEIPDMDISFSLENSKATALNDFTKHYAGIDFNEGNFNVYSEMAIADGYLKGYIKPILKNSKLLGKEDGFFNGLWEGFVGFFKFVLKNQKENTLATKVPIEGDLNAVQSKIWPTISNIFKNAWIQAFKNTTDNEINFEDAENEGKK